MTPPHIPPPSRELDRSHLDTDLTPDCKLCRDYRYLVNSYGCSYVCPRCSCPVCQRLVDVHPDQGGCICFEDEPRSLIVARSPVVYIPSIKES